jgi:hypothetical protein
VNDDLVAVAAGDANAAAIGVHVQYTAWRNRKAAIQLPFGRLCGAGDCDYEGNGEKASHEDPLTS